MDSLPGYGSVIPLRWNLPMRPCILGKKMRETPDSVIQNHLIPFGVVFLDAYFRKWWKQIIKSCILHRKKSCWNIHVDLMNWTFFWGLQLASFCWRRASATAVVAVVFLADRLNKHMIHSPGRWTCAGCNALAALLCDMVFQYDDSVGSCWKIWNVYTVYIYILYMHIFFRGTNNGNHRHVLAIISTCRFPP